MSRSKGATKRAAAFALPAAAPSSSLSSSAASQLSQLSAAEQDAQAERDTRLQRKEYQAKATRENWDPKKKEFVAWAKARYTEEQYPEIVTGTKLHSYLTHEQVGRQTKRPRKTGAAAEQQVVGYSTIEAYTSAIVTLWQEQVDAGVNNHPHPRNAAVKSLLHNVQASTAARDKAAFKDKRGAADDGYSGAFFRKLALHFHQEGSPVALRSLVAQLIGHQCLLRGINIRDICLSDLELGEMPNGLSPARILIIKTCESKRNRTGRTEYSGALRHKEWIIDVHFAIALSLFQRFHILNEPFPDLSTNASWYNIHLLRSKDDVLQPISYEAHKEPISKAFTALGLTGCKKVTHAARGSGAREAELLEVASADIERLGGWKSVDAMTQSYLTHLPIRALRAMSGFSPNGGTYYLARDTLSPPNDLELQVFPQVEQWQTRIDEEAISTSGGIDKFLDLLRHLRRVLLQDAPGLLKLCPSHPALRHSIFRSVSFLAWTAHQQGCLQQHQDPDELSLRSAVPVLAQKLDTICEQQRAMQQQLTRLEESKEDEDKLSRRRDEEIMYEVQRHNAAIIRLRTAPASAFADIHHHPEVPTTPRPHLSGTIAPVSPALPLSQSPSPSAFARAPLGGAEEATTYELSNEVSTVAEAWEEWNSGWRGGPSLQSLEDRFGTAWCEGAKSAKRRAFLRRMVIINAVRQRSAGTVEQEVQRLQQRMGTNSLDWLRKQLERDKAARTATAW